MLVGIVEISTRVIQLYWMALTRIISGEGVAPVNKLLRKVREEERTSEGRESWRCGYCRKFYHPYSQGWCMIRTHQLGGKGTSPRLGEIYYFHAIPAEVIEQIMWIKAVVMEKQQDDYDVIEAVQSIPIGNARIMLTDFKEHVFFHQAIWVRMVVIRTHGWRFTKHFGISSAIELKINLHSIL